MVISIRRHCCHWSLYVFDGENNFMTFAVIAVIKRRGGRFYGENGIDWLIVSVTRRRFVWLDTYVLAM